MTTVTTLDPALAASGDRHRGGLHLLPAPTPKLVTGLVLAGTVIAFGLLGPLLVGDPDRISDASLQAPGRAHLLGTTQTGQDVLAQLAHATRGSLVIGLAVGVIAVLLSGFFGIVGAYAGGVLDEAFSLLTNVFLVIPALPLVIVISSYVQEKSVWLIVLVLSITSWAGSARVLRGVTLSLRNRDYVAAARVSGERMWRVLLVEILPNLVPVIASQFVFAIIFAILGEAGLSFLGLGPTNDWTWGVMLFFAQNGLALRLDAWWWFVPPGLLIAAFGAALSLINFSIDEIINPRLRDQTRSARKHWRLSRSDRARLEDVR